MPFTTPEHVHVPRVDELAKEGLAKPVPAGGWRIEPEGQQRIYEAMAENAAHTKELAR